MSKFDLLDIRNFFDDHEYEKVNDGLEKYIGDFPCEIRSELLLLRCVNDFARNLRITEDTSKIFDYDLSLVFHEFQLDFEKTLIKVKETQKERQALKDALLGFFSDIEAIINDAIACLGLFTEEMEEFTEAEKGKEKLHGRCLRLLDEMCEKEIAWKTHIFSIIQKNFSDIFNMEWILSENKECESVIDCHIIFTD